MGGVRAPGAVTRRTATRARLGVLLELGFVAIALLCYLVVRSITMHHTGAAVDHAREVLALERTLGIDWERGVQHTAAEVPGLDTALAQFYFWGWFPAFVPVLVWLYLHHRDAYRRTRNALLASGVAGLLIYAFYPTAPPWIVGAGFADPVTGSWMHDVARPRMIDNKLGAMPSFHVGWLVLAGIVVFPLTRSTVVRVLCVVFPALMAWAVVGTGNHWVLDVPAGILIAVIGLAAAAVVERAQPRVIAWWRRSTGAPPPAHRFPSGSRGSLDAWAPPIPSPRPSHRAGNRAGHRRAPGGGTSSSPRSRPRWPSP
jgi:hypothetical protein